MAHSRNDAVPPTSSSRLVLDADRPNLPTETVAVAQQLSNMEIDNRSSALLRHRLFPRAMAWNVHQAAQHGGARYEDDLAYPPRDEYATGYAADARLPPFKAPKRHATGSPMPAPPPSLGGLAPRVDDRERLFRTIGKWLDQRPPADDDRAYAARPHYQHQDHYEAAPQQYAPQDYSPAYARSYASEPPVMARGLVLHGNGSIYDMVKLHQHGRSGSPSPSAYTASSSRTVSMSSYPSPTHSHSSADGVTVSKKRQRGPSGSTAPPTGATTVSSSGVARPGMSTSNAKRCSVQDCGKIAVSKGLCRGHGGGRRCTFAGCTKCAQSRSPFCWAHGGGKRCEAPNCRRSRKTKRFCVDHVEMENTVPLSTSTDSDSDHRPHTPHQDPVDNFAATVAAPHSVAALHLPSLTDALKRAVPAAVARASQTVTLPQSRDRLWPVPQSMVSNPFH